MSIQKNNIQTFKGINSAIKTNLKEAVIHKNSFKAIAKLSFYTYKKSGKLQKV
jgi:hypothetical protein